MEGVHVVHEIDIIILLDPVIHAFNCLPKLNLILIILSLRETSQAIIDRVDLLVDAADLINRSILVQIVETVV